MHVFATTIVPKRRRPDPKWTPSPPQKGVRAGAIEPNTVRLASLQGATSQGSPVARVCGHFRIRTRDVRGVPVSLPEPILIVTAMG